ncbi:hypothetical protein P7K49_020347 [Saguinus oedipus]|uniref:Uncharacterized protein n=1 Tax=Saguinus oedipus TaxID=9490 RepID=A0ABQ9V058_SAGOE|nr:hypothetical protein P7K49_020347 [Saguinus oedipus]
MAREAQEGASRPSRLGLREWRIPVWLCIHTARLAEILHSSQLPSEWSSGGCRSLRSGFEVCGKLGLVLSYRTLLSSASLELPQHWRGLRAEFSLWLTALNGSACEGASPAFFCCE